MFVKPDLLLLHAPSVYDFRKDAILYGPISDVVPSTPIFEMYPVGFSSISEHLLTLGLETRIVNLAFRMLDDPTFDAEKKVAGLKPRLAFGIDLHWLPHAHGSVEVAKLCKKHHPELPVIFGGIASSYFHEELIELPEIDYVFRGDSTEVPLGMLMQVLDESPEPEVRDAWMAKIPNLTWRDSQGQTRINPATNFPRVIDAFSNNYLNLFKSSLKFGDIKSQIPFHDWWEYPITAIMTCRGCNEGCGICGGSTPAQKGYIGRNRTAFRSPELIGRDVATIARYTHGPIFLIGDLRQHGRAYADTVLEAIGRAGIDNEVIIELFNGADESYMEKIAKHVRNFNFEMSPETHDDAVRKASGKHYTTEDVERSIELAMKYGCNKFDLFFMTGVPGQSFDSVMETIDYSKTLMERFDQRLALFVSPLAPFLDPGSLVWSDPEKHGYKLLFTDFQSHRDALAAPSWKYTLNYETNWMTRDEIVGSTYEAALRLNKAKFETGRVDKVTFEDVDRRIRKAVDLLQRIDVIMQGKKGLERDQALAALKSEVDSASADSICAAHEIKWPMIARNFRYVNIAIDILLGRKL
jgi:B12-binding domain/radical SAM domain protein